MREEKGFAFGELLGNPVAFGELTDDISTSAGELVVGVGDRGKLGKTTSLGNADGNKANNTDTTIVMENCRGR